MVINSQGFEHDRLYRASSFPFFHWSLFSPSPKKENVFFVKVHYDDKSCMLQDCFNDLSTREYRNIFWEVQKIGLRASAKDVIEVKIIEDLSRVIDLSEAQAFSILTFNKDRKKLLSKKREEMFLVERYVLL